MDDTKTNMNTIKHQHRGRVVAYTMHATDVAQNTSRVSMLTFQPDGAVLKYGN